MADVASLGVGPLDRLAFVSSQGSLGRSGSRSWVLTYKRPGGQRTKDGRGRQRAMQQTADHSIVIFTTLPAP